MENSLEFPQEVKGKWKKELFKNDNPLTLELACGKAEYSLALAEMFPDRNFIAIDKKGNRMWRGAKTAVEKKLSNVLFLRIYIEDLMSYFDENEVEEIWITFPDPFPRKGKAKKRLTSPRFLKMYDQILTAPGQVHLKTDDKQLFDYTIEAIEAEKWNVNDSQQDIYGSSKMDPLLKIQTYYEKLHLEDGRKIYYLRFGR